MRILPALIAAMLSAAVVPQARAGDTPDWSAYLKPQRLVEVAPGRRMNLVCLGEGRPTVVFESGMAEPTGTWARVQPAIAKKTRACSYDRDGVMFSDDAGGDGSAATIVADLEKLLAAAQIEPPYVLVGQSYGGMPARLYFYEHPEQVAGMVLVDPSSEEQDEGFRLVSPRALDRAGWRALRDPGVADRKRCIEKAGAEGGIALDDPDYKTCVVDPPKGTPEELIAPYREMQRHLAFQHAQGREEATVFDASADQLRRARRGARDLPLIVLSRSADAGPLRSWETQRLREARYRVWTGLHQAIADSSSRGEHRLVPDSTHAMHLSNPEAVIAAIDDVLRMAAAPKQP